MAVTLGFDSICRKCFAFSNLIKSASSVEEGRNQEDLPGCSSRHPQKLPPASRRKILPQNRESLIKRNGIITYFALFLLRQLLEMRCRLRRCTCFSQNEAIAPRGVRASVAIHGSKSVRITSWLLRYFIFHCRGDPMWSPVYRLTPYGMA